MHPDNVTHPDQLKKLMLVTQKIGLQTFVAEASTPEAVAGSFAYLARERVKAVIILNDTYFAQQLPHIAAQANKHRMASIASSTNFAQAGGLLNYGPDFSDNFRRAAAFVDKILKGAKPADLPFEQPVRYYFTVNRKTAKLLAITLPQSLLISADKVIE
jgi:putative ABC transport system substrate-binding protein